MHVNEGLYLTDMHQHQIHSLNFNAGLLYHLASQSIWQYWRWNNQD